MAGVTLTVLFFYWNEYLSKTHGHVERGSSTAWWQPPPLIPGDLWLRSNGRFLAILMIVFWTWCSFLSNSFWVREPPPLLPLLFILALCMYWIGLNYRLVGSVKDTRDPGVLKLCDLVMATYAGESRTAYVVVLSELSSPFSDPQWFGYCLAS